MGFAAVTFPVAATHAVAAVLGELCHAIRRDGATARLAGKLAGYEAAARSTRRPATSSAGAEPE